jgi:hypothetical protein
MLQFTKLPRISAVDRGGTMPMLGLTQYFFGLVVLTYKPNTASISSWYTTFFAQLQGSLKLFFSRTFLEEGLFTLNATCSSDLFDSCNPHEICFFNSTAWFRGSENREINKQGNSKSTITQIQRDWTQGIKIKIKRQRRKISGTRKKTSRENFEAQFSASVFLGIPWKHRDFNDRKFLKQIKETQDKGRRKTIDTHGNRSSMGSIPSSSPESAFILDGQSSPAQRNQTEPRDPPLFPPSNDDIPGAEEEAEENGELGGNS